MKKTVVFLSMCCMMVAAVFGVGAMRDGAAPAVARAETVMPAETENVTTVASGTWGSLSWTLDSEGRFTISGSGSMWSFSSSSTSAWLAYKTSIKSVVVDVGVTSIGEYAFSGCSSLTSVEIPDSVTSIGNYAFRECSSLTRVEIGESVTSIGDQAFYNCSSLTSVVVPDSVTSIGDFAFYNCSSLTSVEIPDSVTNIDNYAFYNCSKLKDVYISDVEAWLNISFGDIYAYPNYYGQLHILDDSGEEVEEIIIPDSVTSISYRAFYQCSSLTSVVIPDSVTSIGGYAFAYCSNLTSVEIPDGVTSIDSNAFYYCGSLTSVVIPDSVTSIDYDAFAYCSKLTSVEIPDSVTNMGNYAFSHCSSLTSVVIPDSVTSIGEYAFSGCSSLEEMTIPFVGGSRKTIGDKYQYPFGYIFGTSSYEGGTATEQYYYGSSTSSITDSTYYIPASLQKVTVTGGEILRGAFYNCSSLTSVEIPDSVTSVGDYAFYNCSSLTSVEIPDSVTSLGNYAFYQCSSLTSVEIGDSVTSIGSWAFYGCSSLTSVVIPDSVTRIDNYAFLNCSSLTSVEIGDSVTSIGVGAFSDCSSLTSVVIPDSVTSIGVSAFYDCSNLTSVVIPDSVTSIAEKAFYGCSSLTSVVIPDSVTSIGNYAFQNCSNLVEVVNNSALDIVAGSTSHGYVAYYAVVVHTGESTYTVVDGYKFVSGNGTHYLLGYEGEISDLVLPSKYNGKNYEIAKKAFYGREDIQSVIIPDNVRGIGASAFGNMPNLKKVTFNAIYCADMTSSPFSSSGTDGFAVEFGAKVAKVPAYLFYNCNVESVSFAENCICTDIGAYAFYGCDMVTFAIPDLVTTIGAYAFYSCSNLISVTVGASVTSIGNYAFRYCYKLVEIINQSSLSIRASSDSSSYGYIGAYAIGAHNGDSKLINVNDYLFYPNGSYYLVGYIGEDTELSLPADCNGVRTYTIWHYAFYQNKEITSVIIPDYVVAVGNSAFAYCDNLESVTIGDGLASILNYAFEDCDKLTNVSIGEGFAEAGLSIGYGAFYDCDGLVAVALPDNTKTVGDSAFYSCGKLESITLGSELTSIGSSAFNYCSALKSIKITETISSIGSSAFANCTSLKIVYVDSSALATTLTSATTAGYLLNNAEVVLVNKKIPSIATFVSVVFSEVEDVVVDGVSYTSYSMHAHEWKDCSVEMVQCETDGFAGTVCTVCGLQQGTTIFAHKYSSKAYNETHHWDVCEVCGCANNEVLHTWNSGVVTLEPTHMAEGVKTFTCVVCGRTEEEAIDKIATHTYDVQVATADYFVSAATCTAKAVYNYSCVCGAKGTATFEYGDVLGHSHGEWISNGNDTHTKTCRRDSTHTVTESCVGGKATCTERAVCETCNSEYGKVLEHTYDKEVVTADYLVSAATCTAKAVYNYSCVCGTKGTATFEYGDVLGHSYGEWISNGNDTHTKTCGRDSTHTVTESCVGGKATCTERAVCETCNGEYGKVLEHTYDKEVATADYLVSAATCTAKAVYNYSCVCGAKGTATFEYGDVLGHSYGEWISNGNDTHTKTCGRDSTHTVTESCVGGEATCTAKAVCSECGGEYGDVLGHDWLDATCTTPKTCDRCAETEGDVLPHKYKNPCDPDCNKCGAVRTPAEHVDSDKNEICDKCGAHLPEKSGCSGTVVGSAAGLLTLFSAAAICLKKRKE